MEAKSELIFKEFHNYYIKQDRRKSDHRVSEASIREQLSLKPEKRNLKALATKETVLGELQLKYNRYDYPVTKIANEFDLAGTFRLLWNSDLINYREEFMAIYLNNQLQIIGHQYVATGSSTSVHLDFKFMVATAILCGAQCVALAHNHPSGSLDFSCGDVNSFSKMEEAFSYFGIEVVDFFIITDQAFSSFRYSKCHTLTLKKIKDYQQITKAS